MPELPEVETIVRALAPRVQGRHIVSAEILHPRIVRFCADDVGRSVAGRRIQDIVRHGKFIVMHLDQGALTFHLGMTGKLLFDVPLTPHTRAVFQLEDSTLVYDDPRMFGSIEWTPCVPERVQRLGPEPMAVSPSEFRERLRARAAPIKALLLNQMIVRGVGNIYADEALFRARIHPKTHGGRLSTARVNRLHHSMQEVLAEAIEFRGSSVSDYVDTEGRQGWFQQRHNVYAREGEPCRVCGTAIRKIVLAGRGTHYCPRCQRA